VRVAYVKTRDDGEIAETSAVHQAAAASLQEGENPQATACLQLAHLEADLFLRVDEGADCEKRLHQT
jgi:hypothetical protein